MLFRSTRISSRNTSFSFFIVCFHLIRYLQQRQHCRWFRRQKFRTVRGEPEVSPNDSEGEKDMETKKGEPTVDGEAWWIHRTFRAH